MESEVVLLRAKFAYSPENADELAFRKGEIIELISRIDESWWEGRIYQTETRGWFPFNYVRELKLKELEKLKTVEKRKTPIEKPIEVTTTTSTTTTITTPEDKKDWRKDVFQELIDQTKAFIKEVEEVRTNCTKVQKAFDAASFAVSRLEASVELIHAVENKVVKGLETQLEAGHTRVGGALLEDMDEFKIAYESYFSNHPGAVESLRKDRQKPSTIKLDMIRASWAKPLIRMEAFPLKLRDLEKYYPDEDDDRQELGRAIYQLESVLLPKCADIRRRKELELTLLQQPIRNWNGETIDNLGTMRLMVQLNVRAGRDNNKVSGFGLAFSSAIVLITATDRMSGFVMITNLPTSKAAAARHNDTTVELTGQTGHFWLEFESVEDAQEWWGAMCALNISAMKPNSLIPSDRSSFTEPKKSDTPPARKSDSENSVVNPAMTNSFKVMAPVRQVPTPNNAPSHNSTFTSSSSPPPIKSYQSTSTIHSSASTSFCPRPTPPCQAARPSNTTSPKQQKTKETSRKSRLMNRKTPDSELRDQSKNRLQSASRPPETTREEADVLQLYRFYDGQRTRKSSDPSTHSMGPLLNNSDMQRFTPSIKSFHASIENMLGPIRSEMDDVKDKIYTIGKENDLLRDQVKIMRRQLDEERNARRLLESRIFSWRQSFYDDARLLQHDAE